MSAFVPARPELGETTPVGRFVVVASTESRRNSTIAQCLARAAAALLGLIVGQGPIVAQQTQTQAQDALRQAIGTSQAAIDAYEQSATERDAAIRRAAFLTGRIDLLAGGSTLADAAAPPSLATLTGSVATSPSDVKFPFSGSLNPFRALGVPEDKDDWRRRLAESAIKLSYAPLIIKPKSLGQAQGFSGAKSGTVEYSLKVWGVKKAIDLVSEFRESVARLGRCPEGDQVCSMREYDRAMSRLTRLAKADEKKSIERQTSISLTSSYTVDVSTNPDTFLTGVAISKDNFGPIVNEEIAHPITLSLSAGHQWFRGIDKGKWSVSPAFDQVLIKNLLTLRGEAKFERFHGNDFTSIQGRSDQSRDDWTLLQSIGFTVLGDSLKKVSLTIKELHIGSPDMDVQVGFAYSTKIGDLR